MVVKEVAALGREILGGNGIEGMVNVKQNRQNHNIALQDHITSGVVLRHGEHLYIRRCKSMAIFFGYVIHQFLGTYDINMLIAAREVTGMPAIKASYTPKSK
uniref:Uncharacterized protein n=1 Tax=Spongospora subterranea TaxID=70186 RepID=A0A0H5QNQ5_9EUKA|eukprot:CRZ03633.1 hypothetical protein [Spongospora subterranea]